jgi:3-oxoacyl-[acyl-carrier-protein] synthase II
MHRVVVTGIGIVSPLGIGVGAFWEGVLEGRVAVREITRFDASTYTSRIAAQIDDFNPQPFMRPRRVHRTDRFAQFAVSAARLAMDDAAFSIDGKAFDTGVFMGSALGGVAYAEDQHDEFRARGISAVKPLLAMSVFGGAATTNIALEFGLCGPTVANGNSCASGAIAIGEAFRAVARGDVRNALAGGAEAPLAPLVFGAFTVIRATSVRNDEPARASRPFDRDRDGFVIAEGSAVLVLERLEDALARGARIYGEICGYSLTTDAYHMTAPRPDGSCMARAMSEALRTAQISAEEVELVDAHASATRLNDAVETRAVKTALGARGRSVPVTATKGQHGHALGASGAWEAAVSLLTITDGRVPRIVNLEHDDPECDLNYVRSTSDLRPSIVLSNSAGFGGINAALVFRRVPV